MNKDREQWGSKIGFILAAAGSAVGLGNIWKFPSMAGENGGAAFTLVYLLCIFIVGLPILIAEFAIGRKTQLNPFGAYRKLTQISQGKEDIENPVEWKWVGFLGIVAAFSILAFYNVVGGWTLRYTFVSLFGGFENFYNEGTPSADISELFFNDFIKSTWNPIFWHILFTGSCMLIILRGIKSGIEQWSKIMMPMIILILFLLAARGLTLQGGTKALSFLFTPKFSDLTASSIVLALGHSFFTLSLGMGTMITYGSYLNKNQNLLTSALWIILLDTGIALLAGVAIFATVFAVGANPAEGVGLIFIVLPTIFPQIGGGLIWGTLFFFILFMAALTSAISILEVLTSYFIDEKGWTRKRATITFGIIVGLVGVFSSLSLGNFSDFNIVFGISLFDFFDMLSAKYLLPIGGLLCALFILFRFGIKSLLFEVKVGFNELNHKSPTVFMITTILFSLSSFIIALIIMNEVLEVFFNYSLLNFKH